MNTVNKPHGVNADLSDRYAQATVDRDDLADQLAQLLAAATKVRAQIDACDETIRRYDRRIAHGTLTPPCSWCGHGDQNTQPVYARRQPTGWHVCTGCASAKAFLVDPSEWQSLRVA